MALFGSRRNKASPPPPPPEAAAAARPEPDAAAVTEEGAGRTGLARLLSTAVGLSSQQEATLRGALNEGLEFYDRYNNSRLELAFASFDRPMRLALYELLFLLHVNDPRLANWTYTKQEWTTVKGIRRQVPVEAVADLYLEGAPAGVLGIGMLPQLYRAEYESYVQGVFDMKPYGDTQPEVHPFVTIQSVGSIGTVGHKSHDSDLDMQVIYDLVPFCLNTGDWNDEVFKQALNREHKWWIGQIRRQQHIPLEALRDGALKQKLSTKAAEKVAHTYPGLYRYLVRGDREFAVKVLHPQGDKTLRLQMLHELLNLMKRAEKLRWHEELRQAEALLKQRVQRVQEYINAKFPEAEIYLFVYTTEWFRRGVYSSTLEFKESSGSAYEMILNYDTLMPGIQFSPVVPTHFVLPNAVNKDSVLYPRMMDYVRFQAITVFDEARHRFVDLGNTPDLSVDYVAKHGGAIYWEAFKASSGNLPKSTLNLFRFEMLLDAHLTKSIIQILKEPQLLDALITPKPSEEGLAMGTVDPGRQPPPEFRDARSILRGVRPSRPQVSQAAAAAQRAGTVTGQLEDMANLKTGLPPWALVEIEEEFPLLLFDPWWLRFKALKVGFHEDGGVSAINREERDRISKVIDLAFCLHVRISDVMDGKADKRSKTEPPSHRDQVLHAFLERAFPTGSPRRINLENLFVGGVRGLLHFEKELRELFQRSMMRVEEKMARLGVRDHAGASEEVELWLNYYVENFQPPLNAVPRVIMKHLKVARNGIEVAFRPDEGWAFLSMQRQSLLEKSALSAGRNVSYLPERVLLLENSGFASGLAHCVLNGYYGVLDKGTPEERMTRIELDDKKLDQGNNIHNELAFVKEDQLNRLMKRIADAFPYQPYNYMDILKTQRDVTGVFVMLNLWRFGQVSVVYRDNLSQWYCDEFEVPALFEHALEVNRDMHRLLRARPLLDALRDLFARRRIDPARTSIAAWANPNSLAPDHTPAFRERLQDMESGITFGEILRRLDRPAVGDLLDDAAQRGAAG
ncbi:MAG TPA: hypothetical protein VKB51_13280 [bacterium]|nr:hypothetical protein [bacterium]